MYNAYGWLVCSLSALAVPSGSGGVCVSLMIVRQFEDSPRGRSGGPTRLLWPGVGAGSGGQVAQGPAGSHVEIRNDVQDQSQITKQDNEWIRSVEFSTRQTALLAMSYRPSRAVSACVLTHLLNFFLFQFWREWNSGLMKTQLTSKKNKFEQILLLYLEKKVSSFKKNKTSLYESIQFHEPERILTK